MAPLLDQTKAMAEEVDGEILSRNECFAVVRVSDVSSSSPEESVTGEGIEEKEEDRVELAQALFASKSVVQNPNGGVIGEWNAGLCL